jgi:hypothetical protein
MTDFTDRLIADFACLDPMYVDGIAGVLNLGSNFSTPFFRWAPRQSEGGIITFEKVPAMLIVQPRSALICGKDCAMTAMLQTQQPPSGLVDQTPRNSLN